jgi:hypothetical protein
MKQPEEADDRQRTAATLKKEKFVFFDGRGSSPTSIPTPPRQNASLLPVVQTSTIASLPREETASRLSLLRFVSALMRGYGKQQFSHHSTRCP